MGKSAKQEKSDSAPTNEQKSLKEIEDQKAALKKAAERKVKIKIGYKL